MARNTQEYLNGLVNKSHVFYLDLHNLSSLRRTDTYKCEKCSEKLSGELRCQNQACNPKQLEGEITDLQEFASLKGINVSNNTLTNLNFLDTLPNKDKLKGLNLFGNQIKEVDFAELFTNFPSLEKINLGGNPLSAKNLDKLTSEQFAKLVNGIKDKKINIHSFKGTVLMDLLTYAQQLTNQGNHQQAHQLQAIIQGNSVKVPEKQSNNSNNNSLLVGGLVIFGVSILAIGYWWGKKKKNQKSEA